LIKGADRLGAKDILRVLYAPHKVFKDIIQKPGYLGALILLIIFVLAQVGSAYVIGSRSYLEQTMPIGDEGDAWTENAALWQANSGVAITDNYVDYINGTQAIAGFPDYYGNSSIEFKISNSSSLQMALGDFGGQVDCGANGFAEVFFRVKIVSPDAKPENVILTLYSLSDSNFFSYDLTGAFSSNVVNTWNNISVLVGSGGWSSSGNPSWENITGLMLDFDWSSDSNVDLLLDGLFFRGKFVTQIELVGGVLPFLANSGINSFAPFLFEWLLLTGLMYLLIKGLKGNVVWKPLMVAVGYALLILVIQAIIIAVVYTTLPDLNYPLEILAYVSGEFEVAYEVLLNQIATVNTAGYIIQAVTWVWIIALGTFITRAITGDKQIAEQTNMGKAASGTMTSGEATGFSWMKCLLVSGASLFLTIIILGLLGIA
jgi:hypothetical protein